MSSLNNFDKDRSSSGSFGLSKRLLSKSLAVPIRESPVNKKRKRNVVVIFIHCFSSVSTTKGMHQYCIYVHKHICRCMHAHAYTSSIYVFKTNKRVQTSEINFYKSTVILDYIHTHTYKCTPLMPPYPSLQKCLIIILWNALDFLN